VPGRLRVIWALARETWRSWLDDAAPSMGAALAYYTLFSLAPLLLIAISVAGLWFGVDAARGEVVRQLEQLVGGATARAVESMLVALNRPEAGRAGTLVGLATLLIGATTVFAELRHAMDRIWNVPPLPPGAQGWVPSLWDLLRTRLLSVGLVLGVGFLLLVSLLVSAALATVGRWVAGSAAGTLAVVLQLGHEVFSYAVITALFVMIYKWMPRVRVAWRDVWIGAAITALLFVAGKGLIGLYIGRSGIASPFGAAGSLVVLLLWVYWSAQIFLLGAEFTSVYARRHGSLRDAASARSAP
jgi:membrane protein